MSDAQGNTMTMAAHTGITAATTLTVKATLAALSEGVTIAKKMYNAPAELENWEEQLALIKLVVEDVEEVKNDLLSSSAVRAAWWRLDSKVREVEEFIRTELTTRHKHKKSTVETDIELQDLESQVADSSSSFETCSANKFAWARNKDKVLVFRTELKEAQELLSSTLLGFNTIITLRVAKNVASLMAPHQVAAPFTAPSLTESQLVHRINQLDTAHLEKLLQDVQAAMRERQESLHQQLGDLRIAAPFSLPSTAEGIHTPEISIPISQTRPQQLPQQTRHLKEIRFTITSHEWCILDPASSLLEPRKDYFLNHVIENDALNNEVTYFISCLTKQGWQRFTLTFESQKTMASMGLRSQTWRDREIMVKTIINAMRTSISSNNFSGSATNLNICRDGQGYFARCTEDFKNAIEYPLFHETAYLKLQSISETELEAVDHWAGWVYVVSYRGQEYVKKEIPMQEQVESFNYELDALSRLQHSPFVLDLYGVVTDTSGTFVKGILVEDLRPLGTIISNESGCLSWELKLKWARQIISALADIHKMGIVMGEVNYAQFGLTRDDNIKAMGIKKRGCPTGWESPEYLETKPKDQIAGIFGPQMRRMGQKMDMYQAGLCLWMLATEKFPESCEETTVPPIPKHLEIPSFYRSIVDTCLDKNPQNREEASSLLCRFPPEFPQRLRMLRHPRESLISRL